MGGLAAWGRSAAGTLVATKKLDGAPGGVVGASAGQHAQHADAKRARPARADADDARVTAMALDGEREHRGLDERRHGLRVRLVADAEPQESTDFDLHSVGHCGNYHRKSKFQGPDLSEPSPTDAARRSFAHGAARYRPWRSRLASCAFAPPPALGSHAAPLNRSRRQ